MIAKEIMTGFPTVIKPEDPVKSIMELFRTYPVSGFVVVNSSGVAVGIIGKDDLFTSGFGIHIPSYIQLLQESHFDKKSSEQLPYAANHLVSAKAADVMNQAVFFAKEDTELEVIAAAMSGGKQSVVPVVAPDNKLLGVVTAEQLFFVIAKGVLPPQINTSQSIRNVDKELGFVRTDMSSKFSYMARSQAHLWLSTTLILFVIGFALGIIFIVDPKPIIESISNNFNQILDNLF